MLHRLAGSLYESPRTVCGLPVVLGAPTPADGNHWTMSADADWPERHGMMPCEVCYGAPYIGLLKPRGRPR